ncbi:SagB/ThcOx family dehydrogenase [Actinosynnema sp. NPDC050801]|uniref:SagB/ThcOx family dehydrogenase n=1 Tax=unclassified Actinosynnema TaxID=2637065 RepID=UPI0033E03C25
MTPFDDFWTASGYSALHQRRLGERLREFRPDQVAGGRVTADPFELPGAPQFLDRPRDRLQRLFRARRSTREFSPRPLSARRFGAVLAALADEDGRAYPSAGGLHPVRAYAFLRNVEHGLNGRVVRYDARRHAVQDVGPAPDWVRLREVLAADAEPAVVLVLVLADQPVLAKYGQRAGRFGLVEAGAAAQSVCLRMAQQRLGGYLLGGAADAEVLALLGLRGQPVRLAAVIAFGPTFTRR